MARNYGKHMVEKYEAISATCDACRKQANEGDPEGWTEVFHAHSDWGNDSIESGATWIACSAECVAKLLAEAVDEYPTEQGVPPTLRVRIGMMDYGTAKALAALTDPSRRDRHA